jgi:hypothetical protein
LFGEVCAQCVGLGSSTGAMKFEAKKFRPREVVKHVLQMALASMQNKNLILEARVYDDVPVDVIGDVLRIRQVFTNLVRCLLHYHPTNLSCILLIQVSKCLNFYNLLMVFCLVHVQ